MCVRLVGSIVRCCMACLCVSCCVFVCVVSMPVCFVCDLPCGVVWLVYVCLLCADVSVCASKCAGAVCL